MPDSKITALTSISTSTDPANDPLVIVDVSDTSMAATGTTKKVTLNNLLSSSPTATGAFTITGDLTVDTSTLKVDSTNNRVGIGTASPGYNLQVIGTSNTLVDFAGSGVAGMQKMLQIRSASGNAQGFSIQQNSTTEDILLNSFYGGASLIFGTNNTERMRIDTSGNVGIGVTPSAWRSTVRALQIGGVGAIYGSTATTGAVSFSRNVYDSASGGTYISNDEATLYEQDQLGRHVWYNAPASTGLVSWTQAMTLDAAGYLLLGTTDTAFTSGAGYKFGPGATPSSGQVGASSSNADLTYRVYSTGAAAYRFYVGYGGTVFATNTTISAISDARLKENVQDIDVGLGAILALKPRKFDWKAGKGKDIKGDRGFIAQEFEQVFPQLVDNWADPSPEGETPYKSVRQDLIPVLVKAIQELAAEVNALKNA